MQHLYRNKIVGILILTLFAQVVIAQRYRQMNLPNHDDHLYYFGIALGFNSSHYKIQLSNSFLQNDTLRYIESFNNRSPQLGILVNLNLTKHLELRTYPLFLLFKNSRFKYGLNKSVDSTERKASTSPIVMSLPFQLRLKSERIGNFRFYAMGGYKFDFGLKQDKEAEITINTRDQAIEAGIGCQIFFPFFILSPELKISNGLKNVFSRESQNLPLNIANSIDNMKNRMVMFTLHFEGGGFGGRNRY